MKYLKLWIDLPDTDMNMIHAVNLVIKLKILTIFIVVCHDIVNNSIK